MRMPSGKLAGAVRLMAIVLCAFGVPAAAVAETPEASEWRSTADQKTWGLMQVWWTVKYNFAFFERLPNLDWDAAVHAAIPRVLDAPNQEEYYRRLNELTALLHDGHTLVVSPSLREGPYDNPPLEFQVVEDRIILVRAGDTEEIRSQGIRPGMELVTVGDGVPARMTRNSPVGAPWGAAAGRLNYAGSSGRERHREGAWPAKGPDHA